MKTANNNIITSIISLQNETSSKLFLISTNKYLSIIMIYSETSEYYSTTLSAQDLIQFTNKSFQLIHNVLVDYLTSTKYRIQIQREDKTLILKCQDLIINEIISFVLFKSNYNELKINLNEGKISSITKVYDQSNYTFLQKDNNFLFSTYNKDFLINKSFLEIIGIFLIVILSILCINKINLKQQITLNPSNILSLSDMKIISNWIEPNKFLKYSLLYRATRDGDESSTFHNLCDNKGATLTIIKTNSGFIFGGYSDIDWESYRNKSEWIYKFSQHAFLYSMNKQKKYPVKDPSKAVFCKGVLGPTFGFGHDIEIVNNFLSKESKCNSPKSFKQMNSENEFNGGEEKFLVNELEVYLINYK
jgi:hypothetical protein